MSKITLATLPQASLQDIFTQVKNHLLKQKQRSTKNENTLQGKTTRYCAYRGDNGTSCAFGCLIADEEYKEEMDEDPNATGTSIWANIDRGLFPKLDIVRSGLLSNLQHIHDNFGIKLWELQLKELAIVYDLEY